LNERTVQLGLGKHIYMLDPAGMSNFLKTVYGTALLWSSSLAFAKASYLLQLMRLTFRNSLERRIVIAVLSLSIAFSIAQFFIMAFGCTPINYMWKQADPTYTGKGRCFSSTQIGLITGSFNIAMDLIIWLIPMPALFRIKLPAREKFPLFIIFMLGGGVFICSVARVANVRRIDPIVQKTRDMTYYQVDVFIFSLLEPSIAVICSSLATLRPLARKCFPNIFGSRLAAGLGGEDGAHPPGTSESRKNPFDEYHSAVNYSQENLSSQKTLTGSERIDEEKELEKRPEPLVHEVGGLRVPV